VAPWGKRSQKKRGGKHAGKNVEIKDKKAHHLKSQKLENIKGRGKTSEVLWRSRTAHREGKV